uniref:Carbonic anhydrase n=1 Tax=Eutreptiella gymnastica TaxID=73025 RepID=A0A7S1N9X7_9EUGL|mmetsp:Transcript_143352/g.250243  ORF Transcript_143352/g.250243 Transcript_143352/m.250243 type:complete len:369 (+) Transcript_143352:31-1137(+)
MFSLLRRSHVVRPLCHRAQFRWFSTPGSQELPASLAARFSTQEIKAIRHRFAALACNDGGLTPLDIRTAAALQGVKLTHEEAEVYIKEVDHDKDGVINWPEFVQMVWELKHGYHQATMARFCFPNRSPFDDENLETIFENNRKWAEQMRKTDPNFFKRLKQGQEPKYLFIGCADSRIPAQELMGMKAGEMFVHRNVANLVVNNDLNLLSVIAYAVEVLHVKDIIVCGHYECGGVRAAESNKDHGLVEHWIRNIRDVVRLHRNELAVLTGEMRHRRLVELNVQEQCINLFANPIIQRRQAAHGLPRIHGMVYDVGEGLLRKLDLDFKHSIREMRHIYDTGHFSNWKAMRDLELSIVNRVNQPDEPKDKS